MSLKNASPPKLDDHGVLASNSTGIVPLDRPCRTAKFYNLLLAHLSLVQISWAAARVAWPDLRSFFS